MSVAIPADWRQCDTLTVEEWGAVMRVSRTTAYAEVRARRVPSIRVGEQIRIPVPWVRRQLGELQDDADAASESEKRTKGEPTSDGRRGPRKRVLTPPASSPEAA